MAELTPNDDAQAAKLRPALTLSQAAKRSGASRSKLRRHLDAGEFPNAWRDDGKEGPATGPWMIPTDDVRAVGIELYASPESKKATSDPEPPAAPPKVDRSAAARIAELERELAVERARREAAEAIAEERLGRVDDLRMAMRQLNPGPADGYRSDAEEAADRGKTGGSWWSRWTGPDGR